MTVPVSVQQRIRVLDARGVSWRHIAKEVGVARDTVAKYAGKEDCSPEPEHPASRPSKLDPFKATVDGWLEADRFMPRKQRHTAKRVYDRLVAEKGYQGSYSPVQRYVKRWRQEHRLPEEGFLELQWHPGEAQVDFGLSQAVIGGDRIDVHCLVVTFPYSNMRYCVALPGENAECVCTGLRMVFEHVGMAPSVLVLDNATGAGHRVAWDKVSVVKVFELFIAHYRLETRFCNPNSGNEKGSVENAVGFLRRNIMVPLLNAESYAQLTRYTLERCDAMAETAHYRKGAPIGELFTEERAEMRPLPSKPYDAVRWEVRKADGDGRVQVDGNYYLAGPSWRGWTLDIGLRAFDVTIRTQDGRTCARLPRVYGDAPATVRNPATLLPALSRKTRAWGDSIIRDDFPDKLRLAIDHMDAKARRATFRLIDKTSGASGFEAAVQAGEHLIEQGHPLDEASLATMARRIAAGEKPYEQTAPDLTGYDVFMRPRGTRERKEA
ncbi:IS21 family transposase [Bifidobacterium saguinibicoloris]|uniref:IS21 family transposase n=1 Tax=Bifidobacterium saguinibicoloris TaxID=2834433 RepID=UPI001C5711C0|nr:IS21 family transposase [Bifidobacterium saguinibicoloris]MBW3081774.1 IS21 family transposase [Bifidobacterium saguinibicoloris]